MLGVLLTQMTLAWKNAMVPRSVATPRSASRITGMVRIAPARDLADIVEQHWIVSWDHRGRAPVRHEVLPDPCVNLVVEPAGRLLYGVGSGRSVHELEGVGTVIGTKFRAGGFSGFLAAPVSSLTGRVSTLPGAFGEAGAELDRELAMAASSSLVIAGVSEFLRTHRPDCDPGRTLVMEIIDTMRSAEPGTRVTQVAAAFGVSPRTLQRLFANHVGTTPKQVLQRFRRQCAVDRLARETGNSLARLAAELGYCDQAHFTRDIRTTLGRPPSAVGAPR